MRRIYKFDNNKTYSIFEDINRQNKETLRIICDAAKTQALKEMLFMLFVLIIVEYPGTSKTLSILKNNLTEFNHNEFQQRLIKKNLNIPIKPLHIVSFQCTQDSKPFGIEK
ncbi:hypothetical protein RFI_32863 [Reticulomyxa filosa]|uniref:Uncharacterized protein n=1 Tax=Reticulomyxa filosa TaxID=46433 RepID=X6LUY4_RETFI|nr:hypothetical protein RFI_32863 [Reticulomyxa filosa]|eukprot:ETO04535.1 hypothetical protein RFI_32863 [Reticulomyxa filosa]